MLAASPEARAAFRSSPSGQAHYKAMGELVEALLWAPQIAQGSPEWAARRPLLVTGTTARKVEVNPEAELAARLKPPSTFCSPAMAHGTAFEPVARAYVSKHLSRRDSGRTPVTIHELGMLELVPGCGASLDGVIGSGDYVGHGLEIKCPQKAYTTVSLEHATQMQFYMGVTGCPAFLYAACVFKSVSHAEYMYVAGGARTAYAFGCDEVLGPMKVPLLFMGDEVDEGYERTKDRSGWWVLEDRFIAWVKKDPKWFPQRLPLYTAFVAKVDAALAARKAAAETVLPMMVTDPIECPFSPLS